MNRNRTTVTCTLLLALLAMPAAAEDDRWQLRAGVVLVDPALRFAGVDADGNQVRAESADATGFSFAIERRISPRVGFELGVLSSDHDVTFEVFTNPNQSVVATAGLDVTPITVGFNFHLTPDRKVDLYLGPMLGWASYGDLEFRFVEGAGVEEDKFSTEDDVAFGAQVGIGVPLRDHRWSFHLAVQYLYTTVIATTESLDTIKVDFDPLILRIGLGLTF